ncbi:MAG: hypothetical protein CMM74_08625 [Rhodospirillaceae bacterium]|jgi:hypothetical protein|nr:hypothetical protein [Rhodospirillaceae bacterium]
MEDVTVVTGNGSNPRDRIVETNGEPADLLVIVNPLTGEEVELTATALVDQWALCKDHIRALYKFKDVIERNLVEITGPPLDGGRTAYLNTGVGKVKIQRKDSTTWDQPLLSEAVFLLGPQETRRLGISTLYKPHLGKIRSFLNTEQADPDLRKAKELIIESKTLKELKPIITLVETPNP